MYQELQSGSGGSGGDVSNMTGLVPYMTNNTTPSGQAFCSTNFSGWEPYYPFTSAYGGKEFWIPANNYTSNQYIGYMFPTAQTVEFATIMLIRQQDSANVKVILQGSNDSTWASPTDLSDEITITSSMGQTIIPVTKNKGSYQYYRFFSSAGFECSGGGNYYIGVKSAQFYGIS